MSTELVYTSAPNGLKTGSKGFCTVAMTAGLPAAWADRLESLSAYRPIFPLGDANSQSNPVNFCHWRVAVAGKPRSVLSRVAFAGADYSGRSNKLAHHIVLDPSEQPPAGPAWMLLQSGLMRTAWSSAPQQLATGPRLPSGDRAPTVCNAWAAIRGDAGWAGVLAESFINDPAKPVYLICKPNTDVLRLFEESLSLLPPAKRWEVTFSTFFTDLPLGLTCAWRAAIAGTPAATEAVRQGPRVLVIDLTKPAPAASNSAYAQAARTGSGPIAAAAPVRPTTSTLKLSPLIASPDPEDSGIAEMPLRDEPATAAAASIRGRKRLVKGAVDPFESEIETGVLIEESGQNMPAHAAVQRGVSTRVFLASILGCLAVGIAATLTTYFMMRQKLDEAKSEPTVVAPSPTGDHQHTIPPVVAAQPPKQNTPAIDVATSQAKPKPENSTVAFSGNPDNQANPQVTPKGNPDTGTTQQRPNNPPQQPIATNAGTGSNTLEQTPPAVGGPGHAGALDSAFDDVLPLSGVTGLTLESKNLDDDPQFTAPLPSEFSNAIIVGIVWPNGKPEFDAQAPEKAGKKATPIHLSLRKDGENGVFVQTSLGASASRIKDLVRVETSNGTLNFKYCGPNRQNSPTASAACSAAQAALSDSVFIVVTSSDTKPRRLSFDRCQQAADYDPKKKLFTIPNLPVGITLEMIRLSCQPGNWKCDKSATGWKFSCRLGHGGPADFDVTLTSAEPTRASAGSPFEAEIEATTAGYNDFVVEKKAAEAKRDQARTDEGEAQTKLTAVAKSNAPEKDKENAKDAHDKASGKKTAAEKEAKDFDTIYNDWRSAYENIQHSFRVSLRLPNGIEIMQLQLNLPDLHS